eukprot:scaffold375_cov299-Chaetoceros_neogracile.AAC.10
MKGFKLFQLCKGGWPSRPCVFISAPRALLHGQSHRRTTQSCQQFAVPQGKQKDQFEYLRVGSKPTMDGFEEWLQMRELLSSDASEEEMESNFMCLSRGDFWGMTCLQAAFYHYAPDNIIKTMIDIGGKELIMKKGSDDDTALHVACWNGASYDIIKMLIEVGGKDVIMAKDDNGDTALHDLCLFIEKQNDAYDKIKLILEVGDANLLLSIKDNDGQTPLDIAIDKGASNDIIKKLLTAHEEGEGTVVVQSQTQSSKRSKVGNTKNASSGSLDTNQAEGEDAELIDLLMTRYLDTRKQLQRANARIAQLEGEHDVKGS